MAFWMPPVVVFSILASCSLIVPMEPARTLRVLSTTLALGFFSAGISTVAPSLLDQARANSVV